jgi:hypothetical protein
MLTDDLTDEVERYYPYPIAVAFRRLATDEYFEAGLKRLICMMDVAEKTAYVLAYVLLTELYERALDGAPPVSSALRDSVRRGFDKVSFGGLVGLVRESARAHPGDASLLADLRQALLRDAPRGTPAPLPALNRLVEIRNRLAHQAPPTPSEITELCGEAETLLAALLGEIGCLRHYELLSINRIEVQRRRRETAAYRHTFSRAVGASDIFKAQQESLPAHMDSYLTAPILVLRRKGEASYLNLFPLILYSHEGDTGVADVFLLNKADTGKGDYAYVGCNKGGALRSARTSVGEGIDSEMKRLLATLAPAS